jgi:hypothetical protein
MKPSRSRYRTIALPNDHPLGPGGSVTVERVRDLSATDIAELLRDRANVPRLVVDDPGMRLHWVPVEQTDGFWKRELQRRVADPAAGRWSREDFPDKYFYKASEWHAESGAVIVLLERHH